jgi:FixJ family two-component response regulator
MMSRAALEGRHVLQESMSRALEPTVYIVDDDSSVRTALGRLFQSVGVKHELFGTAAALLARAEHGLAGCVLLDLRLQGTNGLELQKELAAAYPDVPVIILSAVVDVSMTVRAMKAGALEVLTKPFAEQALLDAVNHALETGRVRAREREELERLRTSLDSLTPREREVMALVVTGMLNKQIASALGTAETTIKVHRSQVMHKMGADSIASLVRMADRLGLNSTDRN